MKQKLLNKLWLRVGMIVAIMTTALSGTVWAQSDTKTDVMFAKGFGNYTTNSFSAAGTDRSGVANSTNATGVTYAMQVFNGSTGAVRGNQSSGASNFSCRNTTTYDGYYISSVSLKVNGGTLDGSTSGRSVVYFGASAYTNPNTTAPSGTATTPSPQSSGQVTLTWTNTDENVSYFILYNLKTAGTVTSSAATYPLTVVWTKKTAQTYTITAQSNNDSYGTVSLNGSVITATPATGYTYADPAYTVSPANSATVAQEGNEFTVTPTANTTVTINFEAIPTYTVTLGDDNTELEETEPSAGVELPSRSDVGIYTFAGWSATNVTTETTTAPTIIPVGTYNPTADITLYPVYTKTEGGASIETSNVFESGSFANGIITWSIANVVSIKQEQNSGSTVPNSSYVGSPRWYSGNLITITPSVSINSISVTTTTDGYASALANSTFSNATASANGSAVTITPEDGSNTITITMGAQSRLSSLTVNYGGGTTYYYSTPVVKQENGILYVSEEYHNMDLSADGNCELNLGGVVASHGTLYSQIVTESTTINPSNYTWDLQVLDVSGLAEGQGGKVVIRFWVEEDAEYYGIEKIVTAYFRPQPVIAYDGTENTPFDTPYTIDTDLIEGGDITVSSSNTAVATVDGLTITPVAVGTTTITITTAAVDDNWQAGTATFTLNVTAPEGKTEAPTGSAGETIFKETFAGCTEDGGNDGNFATASNTEISTADEFTDNDDWSLTKGYPAKGCLKFGGSKASGGAITPSITATIGTTYTLSFKAAPWNTESTTMNVSVDGGTISGLSEDAMSTGEWNDFTANITATATSFTVTFAASKNRFFLDEVKVVAPITATLNGSGYATFCSEYPLDFSDYETAGYSAWQITGVNGEEITFSQIKGSIKGGQGILLKGTAGETIELTSANSSTTLSGNLLKGTLAPTYVATGEYYGLSGNEFVKVNAGTVKAGKALLPASALSGSVKAFTFVFEDDATGIEETLSNSPLKGENIYNLAGQMVNGKSVNGKLPKGIYIVNGKKIAVK